MSIKKQYPDKQNFDLSDFCTEYGYIRRSLQSLKDNDLVPPCIHINTDVQPNLLFSNEQNLMVHKASAVIKEDLRNKLNDGLYQVWLDTATAMGLSDLYLIDEQFIIDAVREKLAKYYTELKHLYSLIKKEG